MHPAVRFAAPCALALALAAAASPVQAAESYDNCTGFIDSLPATITTQGVWCVRKNLTTAMSSGSAITIAANNVTIDCNEYKIGGLQAGVGTKTYGIYAESRLNATVRGCGIRGFYRGVWLYGGGGHLVERNRLDQNYQAGIMINVAEANRVIDNRVMDTGGGTDVVVVQAIFVDGDAIDNTVSTTYGTGANLISYGIVVNDVGSEARGNRVRNLLAQGTGFARGISAMSPSITVTGNRITNAVLVPGEGIYSGSTSTFCTNNTAFNYPVNFFGCDYAAGNLPVVP